MELLQAAGALPAAGVAAKGGGTIPLFADGSGGMIPLDAPADGTVGDVLAMLAEALGRRVDTLLYQTERLDKATLLADSGIGAEAVLRYSEAPVFRWGRHAPDGVVSEDGLSWTKPQSSEEEKETAALSEEPIRCKPGSRCRWRLLKTSGGESRGQMGNWMSASQMGLCVPDVELDKNFDEEVCGRVWHYYVSAVHDGGDTLRQRLPNASETGAGFVVDVSCAKEGHYDVSFKVADAEQQREDPSTWPQFDFGIACAQPLHLFVSHYHPGEAWRVIESAREG
eukprot:TRINITY_DN2009_c0_g1_i5.p1 TRINITY_DN2009_c0_g1~~TRINITY_DN2009_c0_g1_i5.p1  ORF type:complete len:282 (+),score=80.61 TRINITY_DN2009_c0_g1_i5:129-974(+)